jgi:polar amino acid transport system substrate-binding protein
MKTKLSHLLTVALCLVSASARATTDAELLAPTGTLRAVYIVANLAQAMRDPVSLRPTCVIVDITNEFGQRLGVPVTMTPIDTAAHALEAFRSGDADIGFVAPNPERAGAAAYSGVR